MYIYNLFFYFVIVIFSIYSFIKILAYAKYEKDVENNKSGAIAIIVFSAISFIFGCFFAILDQ